MLAYVLACGVLSLWGPRLVRAKLECDSNITIKTAGFPDQFTLGLEECDHFDLFAAESTKIQDGNPTIDHFEHLFQESPWAAVTNAGISKKRRSRSWTVYNVVETDENRMNEKRKRSREKMLNKYFAFIMKGDGDHQDTGLGFFMYRIAQQQAPRYTDFQAITLRVTEGEDLIFKASVNLPEEAKDFSFDVHGFECRRAPFKDHAKRFAWLAPCERGARSAGAFIYEMRDGSEAKLFNLMPSISCEQDTLASAVRNNEMTRKDFQDLLWQKHNLKRAKDLF